jgi:ferredoxin--NADP+ reductase
VEDTSLSLSGAETKARGMGTFRVIPADTVVFAIGDRVDESLGLPVRSNSFVKNPAPRFPMASLSYECFDPDLGQLVPDVFVAGWSREASTGLVGAARKDGTNGAQAVLQYLQTLPTLAEGAINLDALRARLSALGKPVVTRPDWEHLEAVEHAEAAKRGLAEFKFTTNADMLQAMGLVQPT